MQNIVREQLHEPYSPQSQIMQSTPIPSSSASSASPTILATNSSGVPLVTSPLKKKKSRIIPPERRKKVARACDNCKRRKQKCNGGLPCELCTIKHFQCTYTGVDKRNFKPSKKAKSQDDKQTYDQITLSNAANGAKQQPQQNDIQNIQSDETKNPAVPPSLEPLFHFPINLMPSKDDEEEDEDGKNNDMTLIPEQEGLNSRLLYDSSGSLRYIGESSPGSFAPQCRRVFHKILGISKFTHDPERFVMVDSVAINRMRTPVPVPPRAYTLHLIHLFKSNVNELQYVYDNDYLDKEIVGEVMDNPEQADQKTLCVLYLILAIGSIFAKIGLQRGVFPFPQDVFIEAQLFYESAQYLLSRNQQDCNLWLVEAYFLLFIFEELNMTRNSSWINLGVAIRYAQALGMHRRYVNESYRDPSYALHRRKLFRSFYIMDRASSTHLGRSLTINDLEWDDKDALSDLKGLQDEFLKVSILTGKILNKVYYNPSIGIKNALKLKSEMKNFIFNSSIARSLDFRKGSVDGSDVGRLIVHINHLNGVILLTRPFFFFNILIKLKFMKFDLKSKNYANLKNLYHSCIKASTLAIKLVEYYFVNKMHPLKGYTIISTMLQAGLVVGMVLLLQSQNIEDDFLGNDASRTLGDNSKVVCVSTMTSAINILLDYGDLDPTAGRYGQILANMLDATKVKRHSSVQESAKRQQQAQFKPNEMSHTQIEGPQAIQFPQYFGQQQPQALQIKPPPMQQISQPPLPQQQPLPQPQGNVPRSSGQNPQHRPSQGVDINLANLIAPTSSDSSFNLDNQRFEDWLFPKMDTVSEGTHCSRSHSHPSIAISPESSSSERYQTDDFLKDLAGLNNIATSGLGNQFLDDFLFNVVDGNTRNL